MTYLIQNKSYPTADHIGRMRPSAARKASTRYVDSIAKMMRLLTAGGYLEREEADGIQRELARGDKGKAWDELAERFSIEPRTDADGYKLVLPH